MPTNDVTFLLPRSQKTEVEGYDPPAGQLWIETVSWEPRAFVYAQAEGLFLLLGHFPELSLSSSFAAGCTTSYRTVSATI